jgi:hypothetical protein
MGVVLDLMRREGLAQDDAVHAAYERGLVS